MYRDDNFDNTSFWSSLLHRQGDVPIHLSNNQSCSLHVSNALHESALPALPGFTAHLTHLLSRCSSHTKSIDLLFPPVRVSAKVMANKKARKVAAGAIPPTLPPSVEDAYRKKCIELRRRMAEVEQSNDSFRLRKNRLLRGIRKMRLERTILLDLLAKRMRKNGADGYYDYDSENSSEMPATVRSGIL